MQDGQSSSPLKNGAFSINLFTFSLPGVKVAISFYLSKLTCDIFFY
jgi:hypothetical protein